MDAGGRATAEEERCTEREHTTICLYHVRERQASTSAIYARSTRTTQIILPDSGLKLPPNRNDGRRRANTRPSIL